MSPEPASPVGVDSPSPPEPVPAPLAPPVSASPVSTSPAPVLPGSTPPLLPLSAPVVAGAMAGEMNIARLIGTDVKDPAGQTIGEIDNVLLDSAGRVDSVIVTVGGFMGLGGRDVEVRWADLKSIDAGNEVRVDMTAMQLRQRPEWRPNASGSTTTGGAAPEKK